MFRSKSAYSGLLHGICLVILILPATRVFAQLANSPWPDYGGGYLNQHRSPSVGPSAPQILWAFDLQTIQATGGFKRGHHQPILLPDGTLVLNTADSTNDQIVAINPNGTLRWNVSASSLGPWLAADADKIYTIRQTYAASSSTQLRSVNFNGSTIWNVSLPGSNPTQNGPAIARSGAIYGANDFSSLVAVNPNGTTAWTSGASGYYVNPAVATDGTIVAGGTTLKSISPAGVVLWEKPTRTALGKFPAYLSPAISDDGTIYAGQINYPNLLALSSSGAQLWARTDLDGAPAIGTNGKVYVVSESGILSALNPLDGSTLWTYATGKTDYYNSEGATIDANGSLYVSNDQGVLMSLTPGGQLRWSMDLAPDISGFVGIGAPIIGSSGVLYVVGGHTGKVFAIGVPEPSGVLMSVLSLVGLIWIAAHSDRDRNGYKGKKPCSSHSVQ